MNAHLRPVERRVVTMSGEGLSNEEIAARLNRSPDHVARILTWSTYPRSGNGDAKAWRAIGSRVLDLRAEGQTHEEIAERFKRSVRSIRQIEGLAHYRRALELLG